MNGGRVVLEVRDTLENLFTLRVRIRYRLICSQKSKMLTLNILTCFPGPAETEGSWFVRQLGIPKAKKTLCVRADHRELTCGRDCVHRWRSFHRLQESLITTGFWSLLTWCFLDLTKSDHGFDGTDAAFKTGFLRETGGFGTQHLYNTSSLFQVMFYYLRFPGFLVQIKFWEIKLFIDVFCLDSFKELPLRFL